MYFESAQKKPLTNRNRPSAAAIEEYNKVIKKCGVILTEYKDSKWADDGLFLLAKALFYRGNNELQALEKAEDLIKFYPDSPFVPDAYILIAQINYTIHKKDEAIKQLQEFIQHTEFKDHHPQALVILADYFIDNKNHIDAQVYLRMLTEKYSGSKEYFSALFLLGKTLFDNEDYNGSLNTFQELFKKKTDKEMKLSTQYYIALNQFYLKKYDDAEKTLKRALKAEYRENELPKLHILNARILVDSGEFEEGKKAFEDIIKKNPRTLYSAESVYYIAEMHFSKLHLYEDAIGYFNRVKTEFSGSPLVQKAVVRSAIASQIIQLQDPDRELALEELINEQLKLAEYFLYELDHPDSALAIYQKIPSQKEHVIEQKNNALRREAFLNDHINTPLDSLVIAINEAFSDSIVWNISIRDSLRLIYESSLPDSLNWAKITADSLKFDYRNAFQDSLSWVSALNDSVEHHFRQSIYIGNKKKIERYTDDIRLYDEQYIPYMYFIKAVIYDYIKDDQNKVFEMANYLTNDYPDNKYTIALQSYLAGEEVDFLTLDEKDNLRNYEEAMNLLSDSTATAISKLEEIAEDDDNPLSIKANFTLALTYFIDLQDTTSAKPYLNKVLLKSPQSDYSTFINKFYNGKSFIVIDVLPAVLDILKYEESLVDSLADSIAVDVQLPDSLQSIDNIISIPDTLFQIIEPVPDSLRQSPVEAVEDSTKNEDELYHFYE